MKNYLKLASLSALLIIMSVTSAFAIRTVEAKYNFLSFYGSSLTPVGSYGGILSQDWVDVFQTSGNNPDVNGSDLYRNGFNVGLGFGKLKTSGLSTFLGLEFTKVKVKNNVTVFFDDNLIGTYSLVDGVKLTHYDLILDINYHFNKLNKESFSPFVGLGVNGGLEVRSLRGFDSETDFKTALSFNFGADFKISEKKNGRDFMVLSFNNSYDFYGSGYRAKYLNIGAAIKFYSRP